ncbi:MAG: hypothetical protein HWN69_07035 [Desulfobacterales bacterium]|nr:hypothetical protein [Desulfobacterales bacterium]
MKAEEIKKQIDEGSVGRRKLSVKQMIKLLADLLMATRSESQKDEDQDSAKSPKKRKKKK